MTVVTLTSAGAYNPETDGLPVEVARRMSDQELRLTFEGAILWMIGWFGSARCENELPVTFPSEFEVRDMTRDAILASLERHQFWFDGKGQHPKPSLPPRPPAPADDEGAGAERLEGWEADLENGEMYSHLVWEARIKWGTRQYLGRDDLVDLAFEAERRWREIRCGLDDEASSDAFDKLESIKQVMSDAELAELERRLGNDACE
jgi:hypothetical protein